MLLEGMNTIIGKWDSFTGGRLIWILYPLALIYILILGKKEGRRIFGMPLVWMALTIWNPLLIRKIIEVTGEGARYPRFCWMLVYYVTMAWAVVDLAFKCKKRVVRWVILAAFACGIYVIGTPVFGSHAFPYIKVQNEHFASDEVVALCNIYHSDGRKKPRVLANESLMLNVRMYDPSIRAAMKRRLFRKLERWSKEKFQSKDYGQSTRFIYSVFYYEDFRISQQKFTEAVQKKKIRYITILADSTELNQYLESAGFIFMGDTGLYKTWKTPPVSE